MYTTSNSNSRFLSSPPPSYNAVVNQDEGAYSPHDPTRRQRREQDAEWYKRGRNTILLFAFFGSLFFAGFILDILLNKFIATRDPLDPVERERVRREWQKEREVFVEEQRAWDQARRRWDREDKKMTQLRQQWEIERKQHDREVQQWLDEQTHRLGLLWNEPQAGDHCVAYGTREYTAQLDEIAVCKNAPIMIHGRNITASTCTADDRVSFGD